MHQLERELVMVLERMDQGRRIDLVRLLESQHETEELGIAGDEGVVVAGAGHEVVGEIGATLRHRLDVVEGEVELLEGEAAELAHEAGDELIGGYGERVPLGPGAAVVGPISMPRKPFASSRSMLSPSVPREWIASPMTSRCAAKVGSSQSNVGCPSLK